MKLLRCVFVFQSITVPHVILGKKGRCDLFYLSIYTIGGFLWVMQLLTVNTKVLNSWTYKVLTHSFLKVQYKRISLICYWFSTVYTGSKFSLVSLTILLDSVSYSVSALLGQFIRACLFGWKLRLYCSPYPLLLALCVFVLRTTHGQGVLRVLRFWDEMINPFP